MDALDRMFHVLVRTLRSRNQALLTAPFTVGELHSQILPYRHFRRDLGLETNQEYELVLMELLTGSRGYLDVDERLRDELGRELASPNPETTRIRDFADAHVSLNRDAQAMVANGRLSGSAGVTATTPGGGTAAAGTGGTTPVSSPRASTPVTSMSLPRRSTGHCRFCSSPLPQGRAVSFCPSCGQNLAVVNCPACGAELEAGWKFCVACGKAVGS